MTKDDVLPGHLQELRRGTAVMASLAALREPGYGYALLQTLGDAGIAVDANTLYPLLRRLEEQKLLTAEWDTTASRPRKIYRTGPEGERVLAAMLADLDALRASVNRLTEGNAS
ncbi:PadR family transcriptional regulator [Aeromicrobium sp. Leaf350]|uniref:PadR family transcriptional regulator n=1 Tax=Aeromicrobium sp. Leaf350 TaxID=2876565 RepID=UPI001E42CB21|nr:helix-turn-helix transcriptional regulator [Aeromicrobium sp. Leaf350]